MKIQILSDLHVDHKKNYDLFNNRFHARADTLIIAGDIHPHNSENYDTFIKNCLLPKWKNVIIIPGNHEFYGSTFDDEKFGHFIKLYENSDGHKVHYCNNHILEIEDTQFICSTLWSHIGLSNVYKIQHMLNDYHEIRGLTVDIVNEIHMINKNFLIDSLLQVPNEKRCIVVTHHVPSFNLISPRWRSDDLNEAFSADLDTIIMTYSDKISHWIHGHSHDSIDKILDGVRFIRNPMGYPREQSGDMDLVIDI